MLMNKFAIILGVLSLIGLTSAIILLPANQTTFSSANYTEPGTQTAIQVFARDTSGLTVNTNARIGEDFIYGEVEDDYISCHIESVSGRDVNAICNERKNNCLFNHTVRLPTGNQPRCLSILFLKTAGGQDLKDLYNSTSWRGFADSCGSNPSNTLQANSVFGDETETNFFLIKMGTSQAMDTSVKCG